MPFPSYNEVCVFGIITINFSQFQFGNLVVVLIIFFFFGSSGFDNSVWMISTLNFSMIFSLLPILTKIWTASTTKVFYSISYFCSFAKQDIVFKLVNSFFVLAKSTSFLFYLLNFYSRIAPCSGQVPRLSCKMGRSCSSWTEPSRWKRSRDRS